MPSPSREGAKMRTKDAGETMSDRRCRKSGFTLTELMVTILILGLIAALSLPMYGRFMQNWKLSSEAQQFASALRAARSAAVMKNIDAVFSFDMDTETYSYFEDNNRNGSHDSGEYRSPVYHLYTGLTISAHTLSGTTLTFGGMGNTRDSGSITLRNANNNTKAIRIYGGTGNITVN
jgi:prepilin-type N-terminal cleavage/methylation domain-containing protein